MLEKPNLTDAALIDSLQAGFGLTVTDNCPSIPPSLLAAYPSLL